MSFNPNENSKPGKLPDLPGLPKPAGIGNPKNSLPPLPGSLPQPKQNTPNTNGGLPGLPAFPTVSKPEPSPETIVPSFVKPQPSFTQPSQIQQPVYVEEQQVEQSQPIQQPQPTRNLRAALEDEKETDAPSKRNRQGKKQSKKTLTKKSSKKSAYSGKRRNVIYARIVVFGIVGILMVAGIFSFLPKSSGLTASDKPLIISAIRENLNYTDFPRAAGEGFAEAFTSVYLNYDPAKIKERSALLANFVNPNVLKSIDTRPATAEETATATANTPTSSSNTQNEGSVDIPAASSTQTVTDGPYVVGSLMYKGGNAAMFTVMAEVNNNNWIFIQIPMYYNKDTGGLSVSGSLTFSPPILSTDVPEWEGSGSTWTEDDQEVKKLVESDITEYIKAWTASDDTNIQRFLVKENGKSTATKNASEGLESRVKFVGINNLSVEGKAPLSSDSTAEQKADFYTRQATVTVTFLEPSSNLVYTQQYRLVLEYVNEDWFVKDINNVSTLVDRDVTIAKQNEAKNKSN